MSDPQHWRVLWMHVPRLVTYTLNWKVIRHHSYVIITAAEDLGYGGFGSRPERQIGDAKPMYVGNIAPFDGGVQFTINWDGDFPSLNVWTDFTVFCDPGGEHSTGRYGTSWN